MRPGFWARGHGSTEGRAAGSCCGGTQLASSWHLPKVAPAFAAVRFLVLFLSLEQALRVRSRLVEQNTDRLRLPSRHHPSSQIRSERDAPTASRRPGGCPTASGRPYIPPRLLTGRDGPGLPARVGGQGTLQADLQLPRRWVPQRGSSGWDAADRVAASRLAAGGAPVLLGG